jgi:hypothetical protein
MVVFYVSGHGYGHATRSAATIRALRAIEPSLQVAVRTSAPAMLFDAWVRHTYRPVEGSIVETPDALAVDLAASASNIRLFLENSSAFLDAEEEFVRTSGTRLLIGDIPFLIGELANRTGLRSIAVANFLWHWVMAGAADAELLDRMRAGYAKYSLALRMPLSHPEEWDIFPEVIDVPLVTPRSCRSRDEIRRELGLTRPAVLLGGRGTLTGDALDRVRRESPEFHFLLPSDGPVYSDLLRAADVVASKIGYSIAAECIAERKPLLYPPRTGFREEAILREEVPRHAAVREIPVSDWMSGNWRVYLRELLDMPTAEPRIGVNGAAVCAEIIASYLPI